MSEITAERLVSAYIKLRTARQELKAKYDTEEAVLEKQQNMVTERLQDMMKEIGVDSLKTKFGTVSRKIKVRYWPSDWGAHGRDGLGADLRVRAELGCGR